MRKISLFVWILVVSFSISGLASTSEQDTASPDADLSTFESYRETVWQYFGREVMGVAVSPAIPYRELITKHYTEDELDAIEAENLSIGELNAKYPIECLRKISYLRDTRYVAVYASESGFLRVFFDWKGDIKPIHYTIYRMEDKPKHTLPEFFANVGMQSTFQEVLAYDPGAEIEIDLDEFGHHVPTTTHYTSDGYMVYIRYVSEQTIHPGLIFRITTELLP